MRTRSSAVQRSLYGLIAASSVLLIGAQVTAARAADDAPTVVLHYNNQDLASDAGAQRLLRRIEVAAHGVCFDQDLQPLPMHQAARRCYLAAVAHAVDAVKAPRVKAAYAAKYGSVTAPTEARESPVPSMQHIRRG